MSGKSFSGHRMLARMGVVLDPERMAAFVRNMRISGVCLGVVLITGSVVLATMNGGFDWTSYHSSTSRSGSGTGLSYEGTGVVFGIVFLLSPLAIGFALRSGAGEVLYLNGTELTAVKPGRRPPEVYDLTRVRSAVRLEKAPGSRPGSAEARQKTAGYQPVLVLFSESGDRESKIELANLRTRYMRPADEIRMLESAMRFTTNAETQHAAGQLRTVMRWNMLPIIHDAAPDAIPASPEDASSEPIPRTRVASGVASPEIEIAEPDPR